ncbi:hypothetical protein [Bacteroides uniformis]|uniref:hypothetical protein n=1 Tax=Bacteroides uniformis TaxID=820 RepID=UPI0039B61F9C
MAAQNQTMHEAEAYLRNTKNPPSLYVKIGGKRRRLFINRKENAIGIIAPGKRRRGHLFNDWDAIEKILYPSQAGIEETERKLVLKYQRLAQTATFKSNWLKCIASADPDKSLYENHITTDTRIDGKCIRLRTLEKYCGSQVLGRFKEAVRNGISYFSCSFEFRGYDGTLWCDPQRDGTICAGFINESHGTCNGYYYLLINDETLIGYDAD